MDPRLTSVTDFNYHAYLYATDDHPYRTATSGGAAIGSGLNTLSNFDWVDFTRVKWATCSDASSADCLTPKGVTFMRKIIDTGVYIDFYNIHTDVSMISRKFFMFRVVLVYLEP